MKSSLYLSFALALTMALVVGTGCRRKPKTPTPIPPVAGTQRGTTSQQPPIDPGFAVGGDEGGIRTLPGGPGGTGLDGGPGGGELGSFAASTEDAQMFSANTVYFDYDRSTIKSGEQSKIEAVGDYLKGNPTHAVRVEGHCDERGTEGYNLALGERRALAIREYLTRLGVSPDKVTTLSYGEARPAVDGQNESAYARNRRGEFILLKP